MADQPEDVRKKEGRFVLTAGQTSALKLLIQASLEVGPDRAPAAAINAACASYCLLAVAGVGTDDSVKEKLKHGIDIMWEAAKVALKNGEAKRLTDGLPTVNSKGGKS